MQVFINSSLWENSGRVGRLVICLILILFFKNSFRSSSAFSRPITLSKLSFSKMNISLDLA